MINNVDNRKGFTLVELIVTLAIMGIVIAAVYSLNLFGIKSFNKGDSRVGIQYDVRLAADRISEKVTYATGMKLYNDAEIDGIIAANSFIANKEYIYIKNEPSGKKSLIHRIGAVEFTILNSVDEVLSLQFEPRNSGRTLFYSVIGTNKGESFSLDSQICLTNIGSGSIQNSASGPVGSALEFGPISDTDAVQADISNITPPALINNVTTLLKLPVAGPNGTIMLWSSLDANLVIPVVTPTDILNGYVNATVIKPPLDSSDVSSLLTVEVKKGVVSQTATYTLTIPPVQHLTLDTGTLVSGTVGDAYISSLTSYGGDGNYSFTGTGLPPGLSVNSSGAITGTPTTNGTYTMHVTVTDGSLQVASGDINIEIYDPVLINTTNLPEGIKNRSYSCPISVSGGQGNITITVSGLPDGIRFDGITNIIGVPTSHGSSSVTITASDAYGRTNTKTLTLKINNN